jgi:hypothetical protein
VITQIPYTSTQSFATLDQANKYQAEKLHRAAWFDAVNEDREKALKQATEKLSCLNWVGDKLDDDQAQAFPRVINKCGFPVVYEFPNFLVSATCELAFFMLKNDTSGATSDGIKSVSLAGMKVDFSEGKTGEVIPDEAWQYIEKYIRPSRALYRS